MAINKYVYFQFEKKQNSYLRNSFLFVCLLYFFPKLVWLKGLSVSFRKTSSSHINLGVYGTGLGLGLIIDAVDNIKPY